MTLTLLGWLLIAVSIAISALLIFSRLRPSSWGFGQNLRGTAGTLMGAAALCLLVTGIGAATYDGEPPKATASGHVDGDVARLTDYARSIGVDKPASKAAPDKPPADVNTMIEQLAARLQTAPEDKKGWRMLAWSYFHLGRYKEATAALARAIELDPNSDELKAAYEDAKAKASGNDDSETASSLQTEAAGKSGDGPSVEKHTQSEVTPPREHEAEIRSMVDRLADRLESSPRDLEGWTLLMRSRVVRGEKEVAATAFRKALEVFKDDSAASGKIRATATELGLRAE
jgi:cytochrome c-type biogenesis protein CcmH